MIGVNGLSGKSENYYISWLKFLYHYKLRAILLGDRRRTERMYKRIFGKKPDLDHPKTMNEKICWLKLNDHKDIYTLLADKYRVREYYKEHFGEEYLVPLVWKTDRWQDVKKENMPDYPFVIKANTGAGTWRIIRDRNEVDYAELRNECRKWMHLNQYYRTQEWQYKNIKPCIIVEKLITDSQGRVPQDIKLHYFNGKLEFIYCVVDREGDAYRALFTPEWELLPFQWVSDKKYKKIDKPITEPRPVMLDKMIEIGNEMAKDFKYLRMDFYACEDKMYIGETTLYHGAGYNRFHPAEYDWICGERLKLK